MPKRKTDPLVVALDEARKKANLTQVELAKRCKLLPASISRFFIMEHSPTLKMLRKIAKGIPAEIKFEVVKIEQVDHEN